MRDGLAQSTRKQYAGGVSAFLSFCDESSIPDHLRLPANEFLLCAFAASKAGRQGRQSVRNAMSGLRAWHIEQGVQWNGRLQLQYVLTGVGRRAPPPQQPRAPVTKPMLCLLAERLDRRSTRDLCVLAAATVAFWTQSRLGELLMESAANGERMHVPSRRHLAAPSTTRGSRKLTYPWTKTKREKGDEVFILRQTGPTDPISNLDEHLRASVLPHDELLFSYAVDGQAVVLTKAKFLQRCNEIWQGAGYPRRTGHSFRIGGMTELLSEGVDPKVVQKMGRWSSDTFLRYWRNLDHIVPLHAEAVSEGRQRADRRRA
jgi:hypothetical protein